MKKNFTFIALLVLASFQSFAQAIIFSENVGTVAGPISINSYTGWQNNGVPYVFIGSGDVRNTSASSGYTGASGGSNVFFTNAVNTDFTISGIDTHAYGGITLTLGHFKSAIAGSNELQIEVSDNGGPYTPLNYTRGVGAGTAVWQLIAPTGTIPSSTNLSIRFRQTSAAAGTFRVDDIVLTASTLLPISCKTFSAYLKDNRVDVSWTATCTNSLAYFDVERSTDGVSFKKIGKVNAVGIGEFNYSYADLNPEKGNAYYRLKMVDVDGKYTNTWLSNIKWGKQAFGISNIFPSLATSIVQLQISSDKSIQAETKIIDVVGRIVKKQTLHLSEGNINYPLDVTTLGTGSYFVVVDADGKTAVTRFIKQ